MPVETTQALRGVGLSLYSVSTGAWLPVIASFRSRGNGVSSFTKLAARAARLGKDILHQRSSWQSVKEEQGPEDDDTESNPAFKIFSRQLPTVKPSGSGTQICVFGRKTPTINVPRSLMQVWFPALDPPRGSKLSVKIDAKDAESPIDVKIWLRLNPPAFGRHVGEWFNVVSYTATRRCSDSVWKYICEQKQVERLAHADSGK